MRYPLPALIKRKNPNLRRKAITLREISVPSMLATDLFRLAYKPVIDAWFNVIPKIEADYARALSEITFDSPNDLRATIDMFSTDIQRILLLLTPKLQDWALRVETRVRGQWRGSILSATGVDVNTLIGPEDVRQTLETYVAWNVDLVSDVSAQIKQRISAEVFTGLNERRPARDVGKAIREATGLGRDRSLRIASDQLGKLSGALAEERQREAGIDEIIWRSSHKRHPRPHHAARDGKHFWLETKEAVDGSETVAPGDWAQQPPFCGCRTQAFISFD